MVIRFSKAWSCQPEFPTRARRAIDRYQLDDALGRLPPRPHSGVLDGSPTHRRRLHSSSSALSKNEPCALNSRRDRRHGRAVCWSPNTTSTCARSCASSALSSGCGNGTTAHQRLGVPLHWKHCADILVRPRNMHCKARASADKSPQPFSLRVAAAISCRFVHSPSLRLHAKQKKSGVTEFDQPQPPPTPALATRALQSSLASRKAGSQRSIKTAGMAWRSR